MANISLKKDLYEGTELTADYQSAYGTSAIRRVWCRGLDETTTATDVITAFEAEQGRYHPEIPSLPLRRVRFTRVSCDKGILIAQYQRNRFNFPPPPSGVEATYRSGYEAIEIFKSQFVGTSETPVFDEYGLPAGDILSGPEQLRIPTERPVSVERRVPVVNLFVASQINFLPVGIANAFGRLNQTAVTIAGETWAPGVVRFDGFEMDTVVTYTLGGDIGEITYQLQYAWTLRNGGHVQQVPRWFTDPEGDPPDSRWEIMTEAAAPQINFNALPWFNQI